MTVIRGRLRRARPEKPARNPPSRLARQIALAWAIEEAVEAGRIKSYSEVARRLGVTDARMTQITDLVLLPPQLSEDLLFGRVQMTGRVAWSITRVSNVEERYVAWQSRRTQHSRIVNQENSSSVGSPEVHYSDGKPGSHLV